MTNVEQSISKENPLEEADWNDKEAEAEEAEKELAATAALMLKPIRLLCRSQLD